MDSDSQQSSEYSATTSLLAEEIVKEIGEPIDYSHKNLTCFFNCKEMCCSKKIPDQQKIFDELTANRQTRHANSILEQQEFLDFDLMPVNSQGSIKVRNSQKKYELFIDPFDNQGQRRTFSLSSKGKSRTISHIDDNN